MAVHSTLSRGLTVTPASGSRPLSTPFLPCRASLRGERQSQTQIPTSLSYSIKTGLLRVSCQAVAEAKKATATPSVKFSADDVAALRDELAQASPLEIMDKALALFGSDAAIAFSGAEDVALVELASLTGRPFRVFCLDTGRLNPETYRFLDKVRSHYSVNVEVMFPDSEAVQQLVQDKGLFSFYQDGHQECCSIRKVQPLKRALRGLRAWITGQRRDQSTDTRGSLQVVELDAAFPGVDGAGTLVKFNPLAKMPSATVWSFLDAQGAPLNELHAKGYVSIGCEPCTRPVLPHQQEREGRWWWEDAAAKECGLHKANTDTDTNASAVTAPEAAASGSASDGQVQSAGAVVEEPVVRTGKEWQDWPDIYQSPHITTLDRQGLTALVKGGALPASVASSNNGSTSSVVDSWLLVVYAPWCPYCQALENALLQTAAALAQSADGRTRVAKFQGDRDERAFVAEMLGVKSFPSIFMLRPQSASDGSSRVVKRVSERRDTASLLRWVEALQ